MSDIVSVTRTIDAPPQELWALVSDITRMGEWSPEATSGAWVKGATGPSVGARFKGDNSHAGKSWSTICEVTECVPGAVFAFDATAGPVRYANWRYQFEANPEGTIVTETVVDSRNRVLKWIGGKISGVAHRRTHNERTMAATLDALANATS